LSKPIHAYQENTVSALTITPYYPFRGVVPVEQVLMGAGSGIRAQIRFASDPQVAPLCSGCLQPAPAIHRYRFRNVRDLNLAHATVELLIPHRMVRCSQCGVRAEAHDFLHPFRRSTSRFEQMVADLCRVLPVQHVAAHVGLGWHTVKEIDKRRLEREVGTPNYQGLRLIAIDEIAVQKGHSYMTSVLNLETGAIVWMGRGRQKNDLLRFFDGLSPQQRRGIEAVATDMAIPYLEALQRAVPHAAVIYDFFHLVAKYSREVIDRVRVDESKKMFTERGRKLIKGSRYLLLRNEANLSDDQRLRLKDLLAANEALNTVYILKDQLKQIWSCRDPEATRYELHEWCALADASRIPALQRFATNLRIHEAGIVAHALYPIHTGRLEGMHNRIKVIKRQAYGFRDDDYFILKVKAAFPGRLHSDPR
jgi:transposase